MARSSPNSFRTGACGPITLRRISSLSRLTRKRAGRPRIAWPRESRERSWGRASTALSATTTRFNPGNRQIFAAWRRSLVASARTCAAFTTATNEYTPPDHKTKQPVKVEPRVPFCPELLPDQGNPREQLAAWVVSPRNPNFSRATVNRVWALLFGRPLAEPVDDLRAAGELHPASGPPRRRFRRARI